MKGRTHKEFTEESPEVRSFAQMFDNTPTGSQDVQETFLRVTRREETDEPKKPARGHHESTRNRK